MNERIKLPELSWLGWDRDHVTEILGYTPDQMREFYESAIKECAGWLEDLGLVEVAMDMKEHFGVKP
jgi:hypothetical protein